MLGVSKWARIISSKYFLPTLEEATIPYWSAFHTSLHDNAKMKRSAPASKDKQRTKKAKPEVPEYHLTPSLTDESGNIIWPAPRSQIDRAKKFIQDCASANKSTLIVPDKDADGLTSGAILRTTLRLLGLSDDLIHVHLLSRGTSVHDDVERDAMARYDPSFIFILDHGSRESPPAVQQPHRCLVVDHHHVPDDKSFPQDAEFVTACLSPPVATTSLLTYLICEELHPHVECKCDWLAVMGTMGDLGSTIKWELPFPNMKQCLKKYTKKALNDGVSMLNAPRRTDRYDVKSAWDALMLASDASDGEGEEYKANLLKIINNKRLIEARQDINLEVERCTHTPPKFSRDAKIAVFRIKSAFQVHPVIATRWAGHLNSKKLEVVMVANEGYLSGMVNFSCRIARSARARAAAEGREISIIDILKEAASRSETGDLTTRMGESFARGHKEASGGIVGVSEFEELMNVLGVGEKPDTTSEEKSPKKTGVKKSIDPAQKNTLMNYFGSKTG